MIKRSYFISGFDCAHCAAKTEAHLNKHPSIELATIDFAADRLHIVYIDKELTIEELLKVIAEVEDDKIVLKDANAKREKKKIFDKDMFILLARILITIAIMVVAHTALADDKYYWYVFGMYIAGILIITYDIILKIFKNIIAKQNPITEHLLITLAAVGAFLLAALQHSAHDFMESTMVALLYQIGKVIEHIATNKSKEALSSAVDLRVQNANLLDENGVISVVNPEDLQIGDLIVVTAGELIPIDGSIVDGVGLVDTSSLTGEFVPVEAKEGSSVFGGCLVKSGSITVKVEKEYAESTTAKILELITNAGKNKSKADEFVTKFARWYTPIVFAVSMLTGIIGSAITSDWYSWMLLGLKMLLVACPCAIVISAPMAYFSAIGLASKHGIVIKGGNYLDELVNLKKVVADKTGTLTYGSFSIVDICPNGVEKDELLHNLYLAEMMSNHPIGKAICYGVDLEHESTNVSNFKEIPGYGVECDCEGKHIVAGSSRLLDKNNISYDVASKKGTIVYCAADGKYLGYVVLSDQIKKEAYEMVSAFKQKDIDVILLTGDKEENAKELCGELGIEKYHSELLPEEKIEYLNQEKGKGYKVAFVGDGMNDAASIRNADIGFAMGGVGSDIAVESADIVVMTDNPKKVFDTYKIAKMARHTAVFNIIFALIVKFSIELFAIISNLLGHGQLLPMWGAVLADTGLTVVLIINSLLVLYRKVDKSKK